MTDEPSTRLYVIQARRAPRAVVFRRGPTKRVRVLLWHTDTDEIEPGQWLKGRIYERRCDLSPDGRHLLYFAASWHPPYGSWTAVSRPPWLTALALWRNGTAWGGGGVFDDDRTIRLNHGPVHGHDTEVTQGVLPEDVRVEPFGEHPGSGEDGPVMGERLERDGWEWSGCDRAVRIARRPHPDDARACTLQWRYEVGARRRRPWYTSRYDVTGPQGNVPLRLLDWADWERSSGDLLFATDGRLYRVPLEPDGLALDRRRLVADLRSARYVRIRSPETARTW